MMNKKPKNMWSISNLGWISLKRALRKKMYFQAKCDFVKRLKIFVIIF